MMGSNSRFLSSDIVTEFRGYNVDVGIVQICNIPDSFKKIVIVNGSKRPWRNDEGFVIMGMKYFLLNADSLEF